MRSRSRRSRGWERPWSFASPARRRQARARRAPEHLARASRLAGSLRREGLPVAAALAALVDAAVAAQRREASKATGLLRESIAGFDRASMALHAAAVRPVLGAHLGGDEGGELQRAAMARFAEQRVVAPARFVRLYAPGFSAS